MDERRGAWAARAAMLATVATILAAGPGQAAPSPSASAGDDRGAVVATATSRSATAVRAYWTARRLERAEPAGLAMRPGGGLVRADAPGAARPPPAARSAVDTSSASSGFPGSTHGKVFFTVTGGSDPGDFVCSATVVRSNQHTLAWTAGHCVNDAQFGGGFATNWAFVPGYRSGSRPFGLWPAKRLYTTKAWAENVDIRQDLGAARLGRDSEGRGIEDAVGALPIAFRLSRAQQFSAFGYPAEPTPFNLGFDGERLYSCASAVTGSDNPPGSGPEPMQIDCDMTAGASGGGWVNGAGEVNGVTSYGYTGDFVHLYGPYFGVEARRLYDDASGPPLLCGGEPVTNLGGATADDLTGADGRETFKLAGGDDRALGLGGDDGACGGGGNDRLKGGADDDTLRGGAGADVLNGGPGRDLCLGGPGRDRASGCERRRRVP